MESRLKDNGKTALGPYRALDLTDEKGMLCGKILASLGAEVIKVEPPGGDGARNIPPFSHHTPHPEKSLFYAGYNTNKKSITLDITTADGKPLFERLVASSDFVIESFEPGYLEKNGLGYSRLAEVNRRIILTSITPFGQHGPYSHFKSSDLMCTAMSGFMSLTGDEDRAPVGISVPQAYSMGGAEAAAGTMIAHYARQKTGEGQHVDVSIRDAFLKTLVNSVEWWQYEHKILKRRGPYWGLRNTAIRVLWHCKDGWVSFTLTGAKFGAMTNHRLVEWADSEGLADEEMKSVDWVNLDMEKADPAFIDRLEKGLQRFFMAHTRQEVLEGAITRNIMMNPVQTIEDIRRDEQLAARGYWEEVEEASPGETVAYPGAFIRASATPCVATKRPPLIGEHNEEIYMEELGLSKEQVAVLKAAHVV